MRKQTRYSERIKYRKQNNNKKVHIKVINLKKLYTSALAVLIIIFTINFISQNNINLLDFLFYNESLEVDSNISETVSNINVVNNAEIISVIGINDITYEDEGDKQTSEVENKQTIPQTYSYDITRLNDPEYLRNNFYIVDNRTRFVESDFPVQEFLNKDLSIDTSTKEPKVLIFHTHSYEGFVDSDPNNKYDGIFGVGELLAQTLTNKYGIVTLHDEGRYDYVDGKPQIIGAYERMEPAIKKVLKDNPSIEVVIDLHRDGVNENVRLVKNINGKPTAQIMLFNGLCKYLSNGELVTGAQNPYLKDNLALSFQMQLKSKELFPEFTRKIYLHAYRFSLHMKPRSLLVELGAQTNTMEEARNAVEPLAEMLAQVLLK